jgi:hypothetical protein
MRESLEAGYRVWMLVKPGVETGKGEDRGSMFEDRGKVESLISQMPILNL